MLLLKFGRGVFNVRSGKKNYNTSNIYMRPINHVQKNNVIFFDVVIDAEKGLHLN